MKNLDKPWEDDSVDHWKTEAFAQGDMTGPLLEESSFAVLFPAYRETYLRDVWPQVTSALKEHGISCQLDLIEGSMTVSTTRKTWDPYIILKARDLIKLLARSVHLTQALKVLQDDVFCDIIKVGGLCPNQERFIKRRDRLLGPNGSTLKAIEILTGCYVMVQGNTVSVMGPHKGLKQVRKLVEDCFRNYHPVYHIKAMMIKRELERDPALQNESWERFLPKFKKQNVQRKKKKAKAEHKEKEYTPFPPAPIPRKVDLQLESGEYFLSAEQKRTRKQEARDKKQAEASAASSARRQERYVAPKEKIAVGNSRAGKEKKMEERSAAEIAVSIKEKEARARKRRARGGHGS
eukprot:scaffold25165_cov32-Tisochrysis_lutea.AAC.2